MRFSYIDSQGKEIEVDSVESLALRIELGAIEPDTRMYDAVADRWAPAEEHPVFRALSRGEEVTEEDLVHIGQEGGASGAPPSRSPEEAPEEPEETGAGAGEAGPDEMEGAREEAAPEPPEPEAQPDERAPAPDAGAPPEEPAPDPGTGEAAPSEEAPAPEAEEPGPAGVTGGEEPAAPEEAGAGGGSDDVLGLDFEVTMADDAEPEPGAGEPAEAGGDGETGETTEPAGEVEELPGLPGLEEPPAEAGEADREGALGPGDDEPAPAEPSPEDEPGAPAEPAASDDEGVPPWAAGEDALWGEEPETEETGAGPEPSAGDAAPLSEGKEGTDAGEGEEMPGWARPEEGAAAGDAGEEKEPAAPSTPDIRKPKRAPRPAHWEKRKRARKLRERLLRIAGVVLVVAAVGGAGAYVLSLGPLGETPAEEAGETEGRPVLSGELRPVMTQVSANAYEDVLARFRREIAQQDLPERPPSTWLDGRYLSTAGDFPEVPAYWRAIRGAVQDLRSRELALFRVSLEENLANRAGGSDTDTEDGGLSDADASRVREAALASYRATGEVRGAVYDSVIAVADASLRLHELLVARESDIEYEPFSDPGVSRDPVLEAVPSDSVLRAEMNDRLDRVLEAIADAGIPRPITTTALVDHLLARLREAGVVAPRPLPGAGNGS